MESRRGAVLWDQTIADDIHRAAGCCVHHHHRPDEPLGSPKPPQANVCDELEQHDHDHATKPISPSKTSCTVS